jgi:hypothetical protein
LIDVARARLRTATSVRQCQLPLRTLPEFAVAENATVPLPVRSSWVMLSQESAVEAVHAQPGGMVSAMDGPPPATATVALAGFSDAAHDQPDSS